MLRICNVQAFFEKARVDFENGVYEKGFLEDLNYQIGLFMLVVNQERGPEILTEKYLLGQNSRKAFGVLKKWAKVQRKSKL